MIAKPKKNQSRPRIGITLGDVNGIGPEVVMKVLSDSRIYKLITPVVYGSMSVISHYRKLLDLNDFQYSQIRNRGEYNHKSTTIVNCWDHDLEINPGIPSKATGKAALMCLKQAVSDIRDGLLDAIVTGPIDKNTIHGEDFPYHGHTEYLTEEFKATESLMMMVSDEFRVGLVTEHIPLKDVPTTLTGDRVELKIRLLELTLKNDFQILKPRIAVLGLNPHAGDGDLLGVEEGQIIQPVIERLKATGKLIFGPFPADGFFASGQHARFDAVLAMYHDQGLIAFKTLAFDTGVNYTAGLPIVRTSPDHGTAYSIVGKNVADIGSMQQAIFLAAQIVHLRQDQQIEKSSH